MDGEDDLERRLREVLRGPQLHVGVDDDLLSRVHAGTRRRQHRCIAASSAAALAVVAMAGTAVALRSHVARTVGADHNHIGSSISASAPPVSTPPPSLAGKPPAPTAILPPASTTPSAPTEFNPVSVSAVSVDDYWVLGFTGRGPAMLHTTDAGQHFEPTGTPDAVLAQPASDHPSGAATISDVRFANANVGWAYGKALYATTNGGISWSSVKQVPGGVIDLVAANDTAWAVVDLSVGSFGATASPAASERYALYATPYGSGVQRWKPVPLPIELGDAAPVIADQDGTVTVAASGKLRTSLESHALVSTDGMTFSDHVLPCPQEGLRALSITANAVWATCSTGHSTAVFKSTDHGVNWQQANISGPVIYTLGGIDYSRAVVDTSRGLGLASTDGTYLTLAASSDQPGGYAGATFIGFTNPKTGFAVIGRQQASSQLWRTTDGGKTWDVVSLPTTG